MDNFFTILHCICDTSSLNRLLVLFYSQGMMPVFSTCCIEMITRWDNSMPSEGSSEIDVWPEFQNLTGDVISRTAFGSNYQEGRRIFELQGELAERLIQSVQTIFIPGYWFVTLSSTNQQQRFIHVQLHIQAFQYMKICFINYSLALFMVL